MVHNWFQRRLITNIIYKEDIKNENKIILNGIISKLNINVQLNQILKLIEYYDSKKKFNIGFNVFIHKKILTSCLKEK